MTTQQPDLNQGMSALAGPGAKLRQARMNRGMSLELIAEKLHLSKPQVESIEQDDYSYVSALAYARGHLRLYAKIVDLSVHEVLKAFDALGLKEKENLQPAISMQPSMIRRAPGKKNSGSIGWWVLALALLVVAIGLLFLFDHYKKPIVHKAKNAASQPTTDTSNQRANPMPVLAPVVATPQTNSEAIPLPIPPASDTRVQNPITPRDTSPDDSLPPQGSDRGVE